LAIVPTLMIGKQVTYLCKIRPFWAGREGVDFCHQ